MTTTAPQSVAPKTEAEALARWPFLAELRAQLDDRAVLDPDVVASFGRDQAPLAPSGHAAGLVRARSVDDVQIALRTATKHRIPVVTRGAGTGLAGGANALDGCLLLHVGGMDQILAIDVPSRLATVEPGVINATLARAVQDKGLYYAPDPASRDISTIGGNIATNAGGACCLKYGVTGDHVAALDVVLADGTRLRTGGKSKKNTAGFDLTRLLVGSEGTLAVIVGATVRLLRAPAPSATLVAFFDTLGAAAEAIVAMDHAADLSLLEVMDQVTISAVDDLTHMQLDRGAAAMVIAQSDAVDAAAVVERCRVLCQARGAGGRDVLTTEDAEEGRLLLAARRAALPALERLGTTLLDDVAVPKPALPTMIASIQAVAQRHGLLIGTFGHAGDGNLHPTIVFDGKDPASERRARQAFGEILEAAVALGGTITGEHGVGSLKQSYLTTMWSDDERALMKRVKEAFDPLGLLNPGRGI